MIATIRSVIQYTQKPADRCGPTEWTPEEVGNVMCWHKPEIYLGWSWADWYVKLIENRLATFLNR